MRKFAFLLSLFFLNCSVLCSAALPKFLGGSGLGINAQKANLENNYYPTYWENLMHEQSTLNLKQGFYDLAKHNYKSAEQTFAKATIKDPSKPYPHIFLGISLYWQGRLEEAMAQYRAALDIDPENAQAHQLMGIAYAWKGEVNPALEHFQAAYKKEPNRADVNMNLGSTYGALNDYENSLFHFRRAVELEPRHPLYVYQLGSLYEFLGRDELAKEAFKKSLKIYPYYEEAILALAVLSEKLGESARAKGYYSKALSLKPGDSIARLRLVNLLLKQNKFEEATDIIERAFLIAPTSNEGLALSISYGGKSSSSSSQNNAQNNQTQNDLDSQLAGFKKRLSKISPEEEIDIEVQTELTPKNFNPIVEKTSSEVLKPSKFDEKYEQTLASTFSRSFTLAPATEEGRKEQLDKLFDGLNNVLKEGSKENDIKMFLQASSLKKDAPSLSTQNTAYGQAQNSIGAKATYNPYNVGNDMGLWVVGKTWLKYIEEVQNDIEEKTLKEPTIQNYILSGFMCLTLGQGKQALNSFTKANKLVKNNNKLKEICFLGICTSYVILGREEEAKNVYQQVLEINKNNKIAQSNLEILTAEE
ncbi:MAG: tetratricopeptide repeat protein [Elusimicrobiaceae bacterium]|nr:tetratricopeptide repeat protein [Elusimicrobiaceae bacterium]